MKKHVFILAAFVALVSCSDQPTAQETKAKENAAVEKINAKLEKGKAEMKEMSEKIDAKLDEAAKKVEENESK